MTARRITAFLAAGIVLAGCSSSSGGSGDATDSVDNADMAGDGDGAADRADGADDVAEPGADGVADADAGDAADSDGAADVPPPAPCDTDLALGATDPLDAARALGLCDGSVTAQWVLPDGSAPPSGPDFDLGHGILSSFGPNVVPREGVRLLALSSGTARTPTDPGYQADLDKGYACGLPPGFPLESPACPGVVPAAAHDGIALQVTVHVPAGATGFAFDSDFYTHEFPTFVCSAYDDFFLALVSPPPEGAIEGDVATDALGNPVSVNMGFLEVCGCLGGPPCFAGGVTYTCPLGTAELEGTGFYDPTSGVPGGATSWLETRVPATAGTDVQIRFAIYDSGDGTLASTVLVDGFRWLTDAGVTLETVPAP